VAPADIAEPAVNCVALAVCLKQGTLMLGFVAFVVGVLAARWVERSLVMAVFCGSLAALVSSSLATILARFFLEQVLAAQTKSPVERTDLNALNK